MSGRMLRSLVVTCLFASTAAAAPVGYFDFAPDAVFETGDTWTSAGQRYRLYGLQSCLRGTFYTDAASNKHDCGEASLAVLAAFVKDTEPACAAVAERADLTFAVCYATIAGQKLDLAMVLITEGYGFASLNSDGVPIYPPYSVAEQRAREARRGLWRFEDVQHPAILLSEAAKNARKNR